MPNIDWVLVSAIFNIVLTLLIVFQWFWDRARERAVKNALLAIKRIVLRLPREKASDLLDVIDATLATIGARKPFSAWGTRTIEALHSRFSKDEGQTLTHTRSHDVMHPIAGSNPQV